MIYVLEQKAEKSWVSISENSYTWIRKGIKTTEDGQNILIISLSQNLPERKTSLDWFDKHMEEAKKREEERQNGNPRKICFPWKN